MNKQPTAHFRWVERPAPANAFDPTARARVLQQGWASSYGGPVEWRDVPVEQEEAPPLPPRKEAFDHAAFTQALYQCFADRGASQKDVAEATGVSETTISRLRTGRHCDAASLAALSAWAGINPARFVRAFA